MMKSLFSALTMAALGLASANLSAQDRTPTEGIGKSIKATHHSAWQRGERLAEHHAAASVRGGAPVNDECSDAIALTLVPQEDCGTTAVAGDNSTATDSGIMDCDESEAGFQDVWYSFNSGTNTQVTVSVEMMTMADLVIEVREGCTGAVVNCATTEEMILAVTENTDYMVRIASNPDYGDGGTFTICVSYIPSDLLPANDACTGAVNQDLAAGSSVTFTGDNTYATDNGEGLEIPAVWEMFTTTECTNLELTFCGTSPAFGNGFANLFFGCPFTVVLEPVDIDFTTCPDGNFTIFYEQVPAGTYYYPVMQDADNNAAGPYTITVAATACEAMTEYCIPDPSTGPDDGDFVGTVALGDINYTGPNDVNYVDNTAMSTDLAVGGTYTINITGGDYEEDVFAAWIDYNNDFTLDAVYEKLGEAVSSTASEAIAFTFTVPAGTTLGAKRLRVRGAYNGSGTIDACSDYTYGETEDYTVNIVLPTGVKESALGQVALYPNPSNGSITLGTGHFSGQVSVEVVDMSGRRVYGQQHTLVAGQDLNLPLGGQLATGTYMLRLIGKDGISTMPMLVK